MEKLYEQAKEIIAGANNPQSKLYAQGIKDAIENLPPQAADSELTPYLIGMREVLDKLIDRGTTNAKDST